MPYDVTFEEFNGSDLDLIEDVVVDDRYFADDHRLLRRQEEALAKGEVSTEFLEHDDRLPPTRLDFPYQVVSAA